jgi:hypothetical protein
MARSRGEIGGKRRFDAHRAGFLPYLRAPGADLWIDAALCAAITHNDRASIAACVSPSHPK